MDYIDVIGVLFTLDCDYYLYSVLRRADLGVNTMRSFVRIVQNAELRLIPHTHNYIYDEIIVRQLEYVNIATMNIFVVKVKNARTHGNE